jgi:hypothetical protein
MNRIRSPITVLAAALLVGGLVTPRVDGPSADAAPPATAPAATASAGVAPLWLTSRASWTNPNLDVPPVPRVVDLRYGHHQRFDRVVIEIRGQIPGGRTFYARRFSYDGTGDPVPIGGRSGLGVVLFPAQAHNDNGDDVYTGPQIARPHLQTLKALAFTGDFEGYVSFAFALTHRAPYRIFTLTAPHRIVIDFRHNS